MFNKEVVFYEDKLYWIYRRLRPKNVKEELYQELAEVWNCDRYIKVNQPERPEYLFVREIPEATIVE